MWKPYIPFFLPCRQATSEEQRALKNYLIRDLAALVHKVNIDEDTVEHFDGDIVMAHEVASHEIFSLVLKSILVVFDWQHYQASALVPRHDRSQHFAKVMVVFWKGEPANAEFFTWEHDGSFHRLENTYHPEKILNAWQFKTTETLF